MCFVFSDDFPDSVGCSGSDQAAIHANQRQIND
jgi:hypothetical protein